MLQWLFFTAFIKSDKSIETVSYKFELVFNIENEFNTSGIIPMYDKDVMTGYNSGCIDSLGNNVCQSYKISLNNTGDKDSYKGIVNFNISDITNLKYMVLDEEKNVYKETTSATNNSDLSLGNGFDLDKNESKTFYLVIWLSDTGSAQEEDDASGSYGASITFESENGAKLVGSILNS